MHLYLCSVFICGFVYEYQEIVDIREEPFWTQVSLKQLWFQVLGWCSSVNMNTWLHIHTVTQQMYCTSYKSSITQSRAHTHQLRLFSLHTYHLSNQTQTSPLWFWLNHRNEAGWLLLFYTRLSKEPFCLEGHNILSSMIREETKAKWLIFLSLEEDWYPHICWGTKWIHAGTSSWKQAG